jgi:hypothetical protein
VEPETRLHGFAQKRGSDFAAIRLYVSAGSADLTKRGWPGMARLAKEPQKRSELSSNIDRPTRSTYRATVAST